MLPDNEILRTLQLLFQTNEAIELRCFDGRTCNGYFKDKQALAAAAATLNSGDDPRSVYVCLNPVTPERYASASNQETLVATPRGGGVSNSQVLCRRWLLIDVDPVRAAKTSATEEQKQAAKQVASEVYTWLRDRTGADSIVVADSGNGTHLLLRLSDWPVNRQSAWICKKLLELLAEQFDSIAAVVDQTTFNAARVCALYGTYKRKGENTPATPHRQSKLLRVPDRLQPVSMEALAALVEPCPEPAAASAPGSCAYDIPALLESHASDYTVNDQLILDSGETATLYELQVCPFNEAHDNAAAAVIVMPSGAVSFRCHHNGCAGKGWEALKQLWDIKPGIGVEDIKLPPQQLLPLESYIDPPHADSTAFHGALGQIVLGMEQHTEAAPMALLCCALAYFGNAMGRRFYLPLDQPHYPKLYVALVGTTASGRKGTADVQARRIIDAIDPLWEQYRHNGLSTGEGMLQVLEEHSDGIIPRPAIFTEREFAAVLRRAERRGNTLNAFIRDAWDGETLANNTKADPISIQNHHIGICAHITPAELKRLLSNDDVSNGFSNRFLWIHSQRMQRRPGAAGFRAVDFQQPVQRLQAAVQAMQDRFNAAGSEPIAIPFDTQAAKLWREELYLQLDIDSDFDTILTLMCSRQAQQVCRVALCFALADGAQSIQVQHLHAACAVAEYCWQTVDYMLSRDWWGDAGNPHDPAGMASKVLQALRERGALTRTEVRNQVFHGHRTAKEINTLRNLLIQRKEIQVDTDSRAEVWRLTQPGR